MPTPTSAIVVNTGRDAIITYLRNSNASSQTNKFIVEKCVLLTGISGPTVVEKVWNNTGTGNDISQYMLSGKLDGTPTDGIFTISNRTQETGKILRFHCVIPTLFDSLGELITGLALLTKDQSNAVALFGYVTFEGQNKVSGSDLEIFADVQF